MLFLYGGSPRELYALEELHNFLGLQSDEPILFTAGRPDATSDSRGYKAEVLFLSEGVADDLPQSLDCRWENGQLVVRGDMLGFICRTLSREAEQDLPRDPLGRVRLVDDAAFQKGLHQTAYLDRLLGEFAKELEKYLAWREVGWQRLRPTQRPLVCLTHDVDGMHGRSWDRYAAWVISSLAREGLASLKKTAKRIAAYRAATIDPLFPAEMFLEPRADGFRHTFFVMSLPCYLGREGMRYSIKRPTVARVFNKLRDHGHEIALHPSRAAQDSIKKLEREKARLLRWVDTPSQGLGVRNHYLKASFPQTWRTEQRLGFSYDATLGWTEAPGFRAGTARPYRPFDCKSNQRLDIWELPLVVMDGAVSGTEKIITDRVRKIAGECFEFNSPATILWHTNRLLPFDYPEHAKAYYNLSQYFIQRGCQGFSATETVKLFADFYDALAEQRSVLAA